MRVIAADAPYSPCSGVRRPMLSDVPFPPLRPFEGVQMMGSGGSAAADYRNDEGRMRTTRSPGEIAADLVAQFREAGWAVTSRADAGGATAWAEMRDAGGKRWRALVAVLPVAEGQIDYVVRVVGASTEPRYDDVEWVAIARDGGPPVPGELARALLEQPSSNGNGNGEVERPTLVVGRLPPALAAAPLPAGARVIGGAVYTNQAVALVAIPGSLAEYAAALERAGWRPQRQRGFVRWGATETPSEFCDPNGRSVLVSAVPLREGGSQLRLSSHAMLSCSPEWVAGFEAVPLPRLPQPEGAKVIGGGGRGGSQHDAESYSRLETPLAPAAVVEHYAGLLRQAGWTVLPAASDTSAATATAELRDAQGRTWHAVLAAVALSATERDVLVRVVTTRP